MVSGKVAGIRAKWILALNTLPKPYILKSLHLELQILEFSLRCLGAPDTISQSPEDKGGKLRPLPGSGASGCRNENAAVEL